MSVTGSAAARQPALPSLTGLRILAAALVVVVHAGELFGDDASRLTQRGQAGVSFFYVLSGFVLAWGGPAGAVSGWRKRTARIVPLHLLTWAVALVVVLPVEGRRQGVGTGLADLVLVQAWSPDRSVVFGSNGVAWSLSCEAFFYLLFPLLVAGCLRLSARRRWAAAGGCVAAVVVLGTAGLPYQAVFTFPPARLPEFGLGVLLALQVRDGWRPRVGAGPALGLAAAATALAAVRAVPDDLAVAAVTVVPYALLVAAAAGADLRGTGSRWGRRRWVRLGEASFALYLTHQLVLRLVAVACPDRWERLAVLPFALAGCLAVAVAAHRWIEAPLARLLRSAPVRGEEAFHAGDRGPDERPVVDAG